jgi:hypothetical protein
LELKIPYPTDATYFIELQGLFGERKEKPMRKAAGPLSLHYKQISMYFSYFKMSDNG